MIYWVTLEEEEEKVHSADHHHHSQCCIYGPYLVSFTRQTKEVHPDRELCDGRASHVKQFAYENVFEAGFFARVWDVVHMCTESKRYRDETEGTEKCEEYLLEVSDQ